MGGGDVCASPPINFTKPFIYAIILHVDINLVKEYRVLIESSEESAFKIEVTFSEDTKRWLTQLIMGHALSAVVDPAILDEKIEELTEVLLKK